MSDIDALGQGRDTVTVIELQEREQQLADDLSKVMSAALVPPRASESAFSEGAATLYKTLAAKLSLPHQGFVLSRPRLHSLVEPTQAGGVISVVAGPGYGKTAFVVDLLSVWEGRAIYYAIDESDRDPFLFLQRLRAGLGGEQTTEVINGNPPLLPDWPGAGPSGSTTLDFVSELVDLMQRWAGTPTLLALDDIHLLDSCPDVIQALELLVRGLPPGWTVLLSSRPPLPLLLDPVALGGRLACLGVRELRLTPREVEAWAQQNWNILLRPSESRVLWRVTEGWPAALVLLGQHLLSGGALSKHRNLMSIISRERDLRAYLETHVFAGMDPYTADVLRMAGLLPRVVFPRDAEVLPGLPGQAEAVLEDLVAHGFLVTRTGKRIFTIHPLLRGYVEEEARRLGTARGLFEKVADHLHSHGEAYEAAHLYLRAGAWDKAAGPLRGLALASLNAVTNFVPEDWLALLTESVVADRSWLLMARARILQQRAEYAQAQIAYERAAQLLAHEHDQEGLLLSLLSSAFCLCSQGLWEKSLDVLKRCRSLARSPAEKVEVLVMEGHVLVNLSRWDEAAENWEKALILAPASDRASLTPRIHLHRACLFYSLGHYRVAMHWVGKALASCGGLGTPLRALVLNGAAILECATGNYELAQKHITECLDLAYGRGCGFIEVSALLNQASVALGSWDYRRALACIREAQRLATKAGDAEELFWADNMLGDLCRHNRNARLALEHHRRALDIARTNRLAEFECIHAATGLGIDLVFLRRTEEAQVSLEEAFIAARRLGSVASLVPALLYLGWLHAVAGHEQEASRMVAESMSLAAEHHHVHFLSQEAQVAVPILALCDRFGAGGFVRDRVLPLLPQRLCDYFNSLARGAVYPTDVPLGPPRRRIWGVPQGPETLSEDLSSCEASGGIELLTEREKEVLKLMALGMPNKVIAAKMFITEKTVKTHANHVFRKLGVGNRLQATLAFQNYQRERRRGT